MPTCWAPGCKSGYHSEVDKKRHFFKAPSDPERLALWRRRIPRNEILTPKHSLCDLHFEEHFFIKTYKHNINGEIVETERGRWDLTEDAQPTKFPNLLSYLNRNRKEPRQRKAHCEISNNKNKRKFKKISVEVPVIVPVNLVECYVYPVNLVNSSETPVYIIDGSETHVSDVANDVDERNRVGCFGRNHVSLKKKINVLKSTVYNQTRKINQQKSSLQDLKMKVKQLYAENNKLKTQIQEFNNLSPKLKMIISQATRNSKAKSKMDCHYSTEWLLDALLIRCRSTKTYRMLRENGYLPLPSICTLNCSIKLMQPELGFDKALFAGLTKKLAQFPSNERRGILMLDEIQISKNVDFRAETGKLVGMVDLGEHTTSVNESTEGDHALVFLFQPHMCGWVQSIGTFWAAGATPTNTLAKLILQAIVLLENSGARVDGLVADGASTNRSVLASFGLSGEISLVNNKMVNPCDKNRSIYFFCDMPHLLKTIRNNLLKSKEFLTPYGTVQMEHYKVLLQSDLNAKTGLRAVPKLTLKHVSPNNFQKMSVSLAAQLFSKSVADGLELYKMQDKRLENCEATIIFTRTINSLFDLMNIRQPKDAIRPNTTIDKLKELEEMLRWLDEWEQYIHTVDEPRQKLFLSRQTGRGLRVTLKSAVELTTLLLCEGFTYVLTGKFCQDPPE